jgi:ABC-2 type transport system permease protein
MAGYLALELRRGVRNVGFLLLVVGWPVGAYLLFSTVFGSQRGSEGLPPTVEIMVAMAAFGAMGAVLMATGPGLAAERRSGWLRQLRLTPMAAWKVVVSRVVAALILALPAIGLTFVAAATVQGVRLPSWEWAALALSLCLGCLPFAAIGVVVGCRAGAETAAGLTMVLYIVLAVLGGLWIPAGILPAPLRALSRVLPSNGVARLGWRVAGGGAPPAGAVLLLLAWLALMGAAAVRSSRRMVAAG